MYEFCYDYSKPKYQWNCIQWNFMQSNTKLCYMDTNNFTIHIQTKDVYEDIADNQKIK